MVEPRASAMSAYERAVWRRLQEGPKWTANPVTEFASGVAGKAGQAAARAVRRVPGADAALAWSDARFQEALRGAFHAVFQPAVRSVDFDRRVARLGSLVDLQGTGPDVFRAVDLAVLDRHRPRAAHSIAGAASGAASALAITGAELSTTVSGGATAGVMIAAIVGDTATSLALAGRSVASVAAAYGFDPGTPEEEAYLMSVLNLSTAATQGTRVLALADLSRLSQQFMRGATWSVLEQDVLVRALREVFSRLGVTLTRGKLAQIMPVAGAGISASMNYALIDRSIRSATTAYRARYLAEKYGLDYPDWSTAHESADPGSDESILTVTDAIAAADATSEAPPGDESPDGAAPEFNPGTDR